MIRTVGISSNLCHQTIRRVAEGCPGPSDPVFGELSEGVYTYQADTEGAIVVVSITGAKFYKDKELN